MTETASISANFEADVDKFGAAIFAPNFIYLNKLFDDIHNILVYFNFILILVIKSPSNMNPM